MTEARGHADSAGSVGGSDVDSVRDLLQAPLDPILVDTARLRLMAALVGLPPEGRLSFTALRRLLDMTDGNIGKHLRVLVEVGYADVDKERHGRRPQSLYTASARGRAAFAAHVAALEAIIAAAHGPEP